MMCPSGHLGPFFPILIGLRGHRSEWWFQCRHRYPWEPWEIGYCDERFPGPKIRKLFTLLVRPEVYEFIMKEGWFPDEEEEHGSVQV